MQLKEIQQCLSQASAEAGSANEAMKQLKACVERTIDYLKSGNTAQAQMFLEQGFTMMMAAFHYLNLDLEKVVQRELHRQKNEGLVPQERVILVFSDHAELRVGGELRGTIPLYSPEDYSELRQISQLFQCRMEHADHIQLDLFAILNANPAA
jgi:hypothetical protein